MRFAGSIYSQYALLAMVIAALLFDLFVVARHLPPGTDDLMARISAQSQGLGRMLTLLREQPVNVDAPLFPVLAYWAARLPLPIDMALRIPSMIALCVAAVVLFLLVRDRLNPGAAYMSTLLLALSPYARFGAIARPYAIFLVWIALALLCWLRAVEGGPRRRIWLAGLALFSTAALLTQYFAPFTLLPIAAGEIFRSRQRRVDWPVWAALTAGLLLFIPIYIAFSPGGAPYGAHPFTPLNVRELKNSFADAVPADAVAALLIGTGILAIPFRPAPSVRSFFDYEWLAIVGIASSPVLLFIAGGIFAHTYSVRHGICAVLGVTIILVSCLHRAAKERAAILVLLFAAAFAVRQGQILRGARQPAPSPQAAWAGATPELLQRYSDLPLVTPDFDYAMRIHFYAPAWLSSRLTMITNRASMVQFVGTDNPALAALAIHRWTGWPLEDYFDFRRRHKRFLMYGVYWMLDALKADGADIQPLGNLGPYPLFLVNAPQ
jgi:hypothetical protein